MLGHVTRSSSHDHHHHHHVVTDGTQEVVNEHKVSVSSRRQLSNPISRADAILSSYLSI